MSAEEKDSGKDRISFLFHVSDLKITPSSSDTKTMLTAGSVRLGREEELCQFAASRKVGDQQKKIIMKKTDRRTTVHEIEIHEDAMIEGITTEMRMQEEKSMGEMKVLCIKLLVVTLACIGISLAALIHVTKEDVGFEREGINSFVTSLSLSHCSALG